jgi:hypothetical protein
MQIFRSRSLASLMSTLALVAAVGCGAEYDPTGDAVQGLLPVELPDASVTPVGCCDSPEDALACGYLITDYFARCNPDPDRPRPRGGRNPSVGPDGGAGIGNPLACTGTGQAVDPQSQQLVTCYYQQIIRNGVVTCQCALP